MEFAPPWTEHLFPVDKMRIPLLLSAPLKPPHGSPPEPTPGTGRQKDAPDRRASGPLGVAGILGPRAEEIAAAAQGFRGTHTCALQRLATDDRFHVARPLRSPDKFGAEHDVFLAPDGRHVVKFARNHGFVPAVKDGLLVMRAGKPRDYLVRQALSEQIFPTGVQVEGLTHDGHFVISQRAIKGDHPTEDAIRAYFLKLGFFNVPVRFGQGGGAWFHRGLGVLVMDTAPDNFIAAKHGIVPIDLLVIDLDREMLRIADATEQLLKQAPRIPR